ncbi:MAG TPA: hypothetical protein VMR70_07480 [Flavisolibacter sp.]|nr:hypothetical protein [Flavisolibacter sp.]
MKKLVFLLGLFAICFSGYAAVGEASFLSTEPPVDPMLNASDIKLPVGNGGYTISLMDLAYISVKDFEILQGQKLSFFKKIGFKLQQRKLRRLIQPDGSIQNIALFKAAIADDTAKFHAGGFFLGFFFLGLGILVAYLLKGEKRKARIKWALIGAGVSILLFFLIILVIVNTLGK